MAEEKKNSVQDAQKNAPDVARKEDLQITVPNVFDTKNNPNVKMVSVVDASSKNGFRTFGVNTEDIVSQRTETGKNGKVNTLSTIQLRDDVSKPYDTSILVGKDSNGKPQYAHDFKTGAEIKALWDLQAQANQNKQVQHETATPVAEASAPQPKAANVKPVIINGVPVSDIKFAEGDQKFSRAKIADPASDCGYGWLTVPKGNVFQQHKDRPQERNINLREPGAKLYYQIQSGGKWVEKTKDDGTAFTNEDLRDMWKEQQSAKRASRTAALSEKVESMMKPVEQKAVVDELDEEAFS